MNTGACCAATPGEFPGVLRRNEEARVSVEEARVRVEEAGMRVEDAGAAIEVASREKARRVIRRSARASRGRWRVSIIFARASRGCRRAS